MDCSLNRFFITFGHPFGAFLVPFAPLEGGVPPSWGILGAQGRPKTTFLMKNDAQIDQNGAQMSSFLHPFLIPFLSVFLERLFI